MSRSFHNRILRVDLTSGTTSVEEPGLKYLRSYLGGWNVIADVLLREVPAGADPLGPENRLVFAPGVLTGLAVGGTARNAVGAKSPLTRGFGAAEVGGHWGAELKRAGFDAVVVHGKSSQPVYLWIEDGHAELCHASHLWGKTTKNTLEAIREQLGDKGIRCASIGPAGENLVKFANIMNGPFDAAGRSGLGAVMGSKGLKAVAVRGANKLEGEEPEKVREMAKAKANALSNTEWFKTGTGAGLDGSVEIGNLPVRNFRDGEFPGAANISAENYLKAIGARRRDGCYACAARCKKVVRLESPYTVDPDYGGPEYEGAAALGSCCGIDDILAVCKAHELCNAYSLDTIGTGVTIAMAMECFEQGQLSTSDTDGIELRFGNAEAMLQMVENIARRAGLGATLAEGPLAAAREFGTEPEQYAMQVKNQAFPMHEPRLKLGLALGYAVSPTGADHIHVLMDDWPGGVLSEGDDGFQNDPDLRSMGLLQSIEREVLDLDKVRASVYRTRFVALQNCLLMCMFTDWHLDDEVALVRAATGWDVGSYELIKAGERALTLARLFNVREGLGVADDWLPERCFGPTSNGALADAGVDRDALREAIHAYYGMMGWNENTGVPLAGTLHELGLSWAVKHL